ncbi:MAG: DUF1127 domain-containing protein [Pseudomonadota bacterium]
MTDCTQIQAPVFETPGIVSRLLTFMERQIAAIKVRHAHATQRAADRAKLRAMLRLEDYQLRDLGFHRSDIHGAMDNLAEAPYADTLTSARNRNMRQPFRPVNRRHG